MPAGSSIPRVPSYVPYLGHGLAFGRDADRLMNECQKKYGDVFELNLAGKRCTFFLNPRDYPAFIRQSKYLRSEDISLEIAAPVFGFDKQHLQDKVDVEHVTHLSQRMMMGDELVPLTERMQDKVEEILLDARHQQGFSGSLFDYALELIFMAGSDALFGEGVASPEVLADFKVVDKFFPQLVGGIPKWLLPGVRKALAGLIKPMGFAREGQSRLMEERFKYFASLDYRAAEELPKTDASLLWAAQANTAVVAFFALFFILRDAAVKQQVQEEVRIALAASDKHSARGTPYLTLDVLNRMEKLDSCISETLRLVSSPLPMREVMQDLDIELVTGNSVHLQKGQFAAIYPRYAHMHPAIYANPEAFQWDRFLGKQKPNSFSYQNEPLKYSLLPFGVGLSMCPGRHFARNEFKVVTALLLNWCDMTVQETVMPALDKSRIGLGSFTPKSAIPFHLQRRT
ncbi:MAG TPA: cytochrome P450 [Pseudomonadales bacterium]|nr:cytochrome P450 [Pseudomonadales bacterium]